MPTENTLRRYYEALFANSAEVSRLATEDVSAFAQAHRSVETLTAWSTVLNSQPEILMLKHAVNELQLSLYEVAGGLYRPAYSSLRLAMELILGMCLFSVNRLALEEWKGGRFDLKWAATNDPDSGVFSVRFVKAFFPMIGRLSDQQTLANSIYRQLSEFVHGNLSTLILTPEKITFDAELNDRYFRYSQEVSAIGNVALCVRYLKELTADRLALLEHGVLDEIGHISAVRDVFERGTE